MDIWDRLGKEFIFFDGGMGAILQSKGLDILPEIWNITKPEVIAKVHEDFVAVGCDIIKANTFGANALKHMDTGFDHRKLIEAGVRIAKAAAKGRAKVALDIGPTGKLLAPYGDLGFEKAVEVFAEMIRTGGSAGADLILIETMSDTYEIKAAMIAAKENSDLPVMVTFTPDTSGRLLTGADVLTAVTLVESLGACALGLNCGTGPAQMKGLAAEVCACTEIPVIIQPNGGLPKIAGGKTAYDIDAKEFAAYMVEIAELGPAVLGGCCGTTQEHIGALIKACRGLTPKKNAVYKKSARISSYGQTIMLGDFIKIVGERINPTGKPRLKAALKSMDMEYIQREGLSQIEEGAEILDVNVGMPGIDEAKMLPEAVYALQSITSAPLVIDTANIEAAEAALRIYNGKPLLNSVSAKEESLKKVLPLVKKYGAAVVALTLNDKGIPETTEGRVAVAKKILKEANRHGIPKEDVIIDALTMTISTNADNAKITLNALDYVCSKMELCTILGVSNISFGLPNRGLLNAGFFILAMSRGLSLGIINTANEHMMEALGVHKVLSGVDENCSAYIKRFSDQPKAELAVDKAKTPSLYSSILNGLSNEAELSVKSLLSEQDSIDIINNHLIPALDKAGQDFEANIIFLPQLLMSASAAKVAFEVIKKHMASKNQKTESRGKIVLATVKGDVHDIGKNIVKTLLENYNFQVIDLGKNVEPKLVAETVISEDVHLVGLSALMTTTVTYMEETIALLHKNCPRCRIMVGGAVLSPNYAAEIGADFYSPDAMGAVKYATEILAITK